MAIPSARSPFGARSLVGICALLSLLMFCEPAAIAATITFNDLTDSLTFSVSGPDAARVSGGCQGEVCTVTLLPPVQPFFGGSAVFNYNTILDPMSNNISDQLNVVGHFDPNFNALSFTIIFTSDSETGIPGMPAGNITREDGTVQFGGTISWFPSSGRVDDTIQFQSDVNETPEASGASMGLIGLALLSIFRLNREGSAMRRLIAASPTFGSIRRRCAATNVHDGLV